VIGDYTVLGGAAMVANGMKIGKAAQIAGGSGVTGAIGDGEVVGGFPARDIKEWFKGVAYVRRQSLAKDSAKKD
jgi:UDP-3-O-[3-hydroxymyristoyl] glucosamine N-acyltransferase